MVQESGFNLFPEARDRTRMSVDHIERIFFQIVSGNPPKAQLTKEAVRILLHRAKQIRNQARKRGWTTGTELQRLERINEALH